jgi:LacI family transcriptional regulator
MVNDNEPNFAKRRREVTLAEVAASANVAIMTASRALRNAESVRPYLRERVLAAARQLNYSPSSIARALANRYSDIVSIFLYDLNNPYFGTIAEKISTRLYARNLLPMIANSGEYIIKVNDETLARGSILMTPGEEMARFVFSRRPMVGIVTEKPTTTYPFLLIDYPTAYAQLGAVLAARRPKSYAIFDWIKYPRRQTPLYQPAVEALNAVGAKMIFNWETVNTIPQAAAVIAQQKIEIVMCVNDPTAAQLLIELNAHGLHAPEDVLIIGRDGTLNLAWTLAPDFDHLADAVVELLCAQFVRSSTAKNPPLQQTILPQVIAAGKIIPAN